MTHTKITAPVILLALAILHGCGGDEPNPPVHDASFDATVDAALSCADLSGEACLDAACVLVECESGAFCMSPGEEPCDVCPELNGCRARNTAVCADHHGDLDACDAAEGCSYFACAFGGRGGCFTNDAAVTTPGCAVCPDVYGACEGCEAYDRDPDGCVASELGCRMYADCGGACVEIATPVCEACGLVAGCDVTNEPACAAHHGDLDGCNGAGGCSYYACGFLETGACFATGSDGCAICPDQYCD